MGYLLVYLEIFGKSDGETSLHVASYLRYRLSVGSRWLDINEVLFCVFVPALKFVTWSIARNKLRSRIGFYSCNIARNNLIVYPPSATLFNIRPQILIVFVNSLVRNFVERKGQFLIWDARVWPRLLDINYDLFSNSHLLRTLLYQLYLSLPGF